MRTLIAVCGGPLVARLRKTFSVVPVETTSAPMRRRGRILGLKELAIAELPPVTEVDGADPLGPEVTAELAFYLGSLPACTAVLMAVPSPHLTLADRISAPRRRELIPDLLEPASRIDEAVQVEEIVDPAVWCAADWAFRRLGPHQFWVVGVPVRHDRTSEGAIHRGLRSVVAALEEQTR